jgi:hypothetical protein
MPIRQITAACAISLLLGACGTTPGCRAVTGGAIGAAGGAVLGAIAGAPGYGALAGGAAGAALGGLTSPGAVSAGPSPVCY